MRIAIVVLVFCVLFAVCDLGAARESRETEIRLKRQWSYESLSEQDVEIPRDRDAYGYFNSAQVDTYVIVHYDFESMSWEGWTRIDNTSQVDSFWHVEDYAEPGLAGLPGPLEGAKSAWCGAPPGDDEYLCSWVSAPGYGNDWDQRLESDAISFTGIITFSYRLYIDTEPQYDRLIVECDRGGEGWGEIARYDGLLETVAAHEIVLPRAATKLRFRFASDGAWSDEDGQYDSDGAVHVDSITICDDNGTIDFEDFESAADGDRAAGIWHAAVNVPFGSYSGPAMGLIDKDPCNKNICTKIVFFIGSTEPSSEYPGLYDTPYYRADELGGTINQDEMVVSPVIDMTKHSTNGDSYQDADIPPAILPYLGGVRLRFTVYRDMPLNQIHSYYSRFYFWHVRTIEDGCPGEWLDRGHYYYGDEKAYLFTVEEIGDLVGNEPVQVALGVVDLCDPWYGGCTYNPSPYFDNVRIERYVSHGPQWTYRDIDLFQDNFPEGEFMLESYVRADAANDLRPAGDPVIDPGDSVVVGCASNTTGGIRENGTGPEVYIHVKCGYIGDPGNPKPDIAGPSLAGTYGTYVSDDGTWTVIQGETARSSGGDIAPDRYMFDLNDSLLTRGYEISYYFKAFDLAGEASTLPRYAESKDIFFEFTCLPTLRTDLLYIDDYHGIGTLDGIAQHYWEAAFRRRFGPSSYWPDRYDVNGPSSGVSNGPGSRAKYNHLATAYTVIFWDSGDLPCCTISEGTPYSDKSNDAQMLIGWMEYSFDDVGLWVCGDNVAKDLGGTSSPAALTLLATYCGVDFVGDSYLELSGVVSPPVKADPNPGSPFWYATTGDSFYAFGGCPAFNHFDYLEKTYESEYALQYPDVAGQPYYAGIYNQITNYSDYRVRTMWFGFSLMYVRDAVLQYDLIRDRLFYEVYAWLWHDENWYYLGADEVPAVNSLAQNFPNPFNPTTTISFSVKEKGRVTLRVYDVEGRLVRTLVDEVRDAGSYREVWDGTNNRGAGVASGVYFYKMEATGFTRARKMAILR